jgi:nitroreductase
MDVFEAIQARTSTRAYQTKPVPTETLKKILEAARLAPSAKNLQPWHFIVVTDKEKRKELSKGVFAGFLAKAPVVVVACGDAKASPDWCLVDVAIAVENMVLAATAEGLGTCWVGSFDENRVKGLLKIPDNLKVVILLAVGYARDKVDIGRKILQLVRRRKTIDAIASYEEYGQRFAE